jgi:hypothetical protein
MQTIGRVGALDPEARPGALGLALAAAGAVLVAAGLGWWLAVEWSFWNGPVIVAGAAVATLPFRAARRRAQARRTEAVLTAWGAERGLVYQAEAGNPRTTPLLRRKGLLGPVLVGPVGGDPHGALGHYTYTVGSGKDRQTVKLSLAMARFEGRDGLRVLIRDGEQVGLEGLFDDWGAFETQSAEVDDRFQVEVRDGHDPVQVTELLDPVVLAALLASEAHPVVEIDEGTLLVHVGGHIGLDPGAEDLALFDLLREQADLWGGRVAGI